MRQITKNVCQYGELSNSSQETARQNYAAVHGYLNADEAFASIKTMAEHFGGDATKYEVDFFGGTYSAMSFDMPELDENEIGERLAQLGSFNAATLRGNGECKLTGVCHDEDAIDGFRKAWHGGLRDLGQLMQAGFRSWLAACQADCADFYGDGEHGDETFADHSEANGYEYYEDGTAYDGK